MSVDRDRILEQALKQELRGDTAPMPQSALRSLSEGGCVDAETLAAWQDDGLNAAEMAALELHLSTCARCQSMLSAFARGTTSTPGTASTVVNSGTSGTFSWWRWWLAPVAAGATAAVLWMVVPEEQQIATAPLQPPAAAVAVDKVQPPAAIEEKKADAPAAPQQARARAADSDVKENRLKVDASRDDRSQFKDQAAVAPKQETAIAQAQPAAPAAAAPAAPAAREEAAGARVAELQKSARLAVAPVEVPTLDRNIRWRFDGSRIERTADGGVTWSVMRERGGEGISTGSAPTTSAAWFAGRSGLVLVTVDGGATFTVVSLAEPLDIASISATDARQAVISTVSGRRFRTEDAGRTWLPF